MSIPVNGQSCVPPGFRFHPTEEELLNYYLRKKVASQEIDLDVIRDVDLNKLEPWDIQERCRIGSAPQNDWYFFSHKDKKYPTGTRTNRATVVGFWKATGRDKVIYNSFQRIGMRKTLVFYKGRAPHGQKSDWIMHEYRLDDHSDAVPHSIVSSQVGEASQEEGWVVCRVFKKKNQHKATIGSPRNGSTSSSMSGGKTKVVIHSASCDDALDQILQYMGRSCKQEIEPANNQHKSTLRYLRPFQTVLGADMDGRFMKLPALDSPALESMSPEYPPLPADHCGGGGHASYLKDTLQSVIAADCNSHAAPGITDWAVMDRLVESHLNGQSASSKELSCCFDDPAVEATFYSTTKLPNHIVDDYPGTSGCGGDGDLWSFTRAASSAS